MLRLNTFIVLASITIVTYVCWNIFIVQATGAPLYVGLPALPTNIVLGQKGFPGSNTKGASFGLVLALPTNITLGLLNLVFNVRSINILSYADAAIYDISKLPTGLYRPLGGITNTKYKLLHFLTFFCKERKALAFDWDRCCHLALCLLLILFHSYACWVPRYLWIW